MSMNRLQFATSLLVCLILGMGGGCTWVSDDVPSLDRLGVRRGPEGGVEVLFAPCPGEGVQRVHLVRTDPAFDEELEVLWDIKTESSAREQDFRSVVVGEAPLGFQEEIEFTRPIRSIDYLLAEVQSSRVGALPMSFTTEDLRRDEVLVEGERYLSPNEFEDTAAESC